MSKGAEGSAKTGKNKVAHVFHLDQMPQGLTYKLAFKPRDLRMEKPNDRSATLSALPLKVS